MCAKLVVQKPVIWNDRGYIEPAGRGAASGFPNEHGYGHEEWNANPKWMWRGFKVFHTESKPMMNDAAANGELGMIMTATNEGHFYALGVACNVYLNSPADMQQIASDLRLKKNGAAVWRLPLVRIRSGHNRKAFDRHWERNYRWVRWRCPSTHFHWFRNPIEFLPNDIVPSPNPQKPREALAKMHGACMALRPDQALAIVSDHLSADHPIVDWLTFGEFRPPAKVALNAPPPRGKKGQANKGNGNRNAAPAATDPYVRYVRENEIIVTPRHSDLQRHFREYITAEGARAVAEDNNRIDLQYRVGKDIVLVEIKTCEKATVRFAIRTAMGQLLDYRQNLRGNLKLLVVLELKPTNDVDMNLALSNGFGIAYPTSDGFAIAWP